VFAHLAYQQCWVSSELYLDQKQAVFTIRDIAPLKINNLHYFYIKGVLIWVDMISKAAENDRPLRRFDMRNQQTKLLALSHRRDSKKRRSLFALLVLVSCLIVAGSVDAALHKQQAKQGQAFVEQDAAPLLTQMLKHALVAYANRNYDKAYQRLLPLAQQNIVDAQYYLATLYDDGRGVIASSAMAAYWYRRAAKLGHINAQYNIGVAHASGDGVQQSLVDAARWWRVAAISGSVNAQFNLGILYLRGDGIRHDPVEAVRWWSKAAEQGDPAAQYNLGALYVNGQGVSRDVKTALMWWTRAAAQGFPQAITALRDFHLPKQVKVSTK